MKDQRSCISAFVACLTIPRPQEILERVPPRKNTSKASQNVFYVFKFINVLQLETSYLAAGKHH